MKLFELDQKEARLTHKNDRTEKFGNSGERLACDLDFEFKTDNDFLDEVVPGAKAAFYRRPEHPDLADTDEHMPLLRFPMFGPQKIDRDWVNCRLTIIRGITEDSNIVIDDAKIKKVRFLCNEGGTVGWTFQAQFNPDPDQPAVLGVLSQLLTDKAVMISLSRPLDDEAEGEEHDGVLDNDPVQNPVQAANDDDDDEDVIDARQPARARGRSRGR
jgi:hypothetical protein